MSFNAFPIPDILEQLKSPVVDDKIHDIAENKHSFNGPMRLNDGLHLFLIRAHKNDEDVSQALATSIYIGDYIAASIYIGGGKKYGMNFGFVYVNNGEVHLISERGDSIVEHGSYTSLQLSDHAYFKPDTLLFRIADDARITVDEFRIVEV